MVVINIYFETKKYSHLKLVRAIVKVNFHSEDVGLFIEIETGGKLFACELVLGENLNCDPP